MIRLAAIEDAVRILPLNENYFEMIKLPEMVSTDAEDIPKGKYQMVWGLKFDKMSKTLTMLTKTIE